MNLSDLTDDQRDTVALRFVADGRIKTEVLQGIVDDVRREAGGQGEPAGPGTKVADEPTPPSARRGFRFNSTEADRLQRQRLADRHAAENRRTGLYVVPRRPEVLPVTKPHPACLAAARDGGTPCSRCSWLLEDDPYADAWMDRDD